MTTLPRRVLILAISDLATDSRVMRQVTTLAAQGTHVTALTLASARSVAAPVLPNACFETIARSSWPLPKKMADACLLVAGGLAMSEERALALANRLPSVAAMRRRALALARSDGQPSFDLVIANDWNTLPAALDLHAATGVPIVYDSHEFALLEMSERRVWRALFPPLIRAIETVGLARASGVGAATPGIADFLTETYALARRPTVVRNLPMIEPLAPRPPADPLCVLYHGLLVPMRGLETLIESAAAWRPGRRLVLRGWAVNPTYDRQLRRLAGSRLENGTVSFEPPVPQALVVEAANSADVGACLHPIDTLQYRCALPNKLFEYLHAGLLTLVPQHSSMAEIIARHGGGRILEDTSPAAVADLINGLTPDAVAAGKRQAHAAARELTWSNEFQHLLALAADAAARGKAAPNSVLAVSQP